MNAKKKLRSTIMALAVTSLLAVPTAWAETQVPEDMVLVPGGPFLMGVDKTGDHHMGGTIDNPVHLGRQVGTDLFNPVIPNHDILTTP